LTALRHASRTVAARLKRLSRCSKHIGAAAIAFALAVSGAATDNAQALSGFDYCARPVSPACAKNITAGSSRSAYNRCKAEVERYVKATFAYRRCLTKQLEIEVRRTNRILDRFRCLRATGAMKTACERRRKLEEAQPPEARQRDTGASNSRSIKSQRRKPQRKRRQNRR
jgi:hypothetical protein